MPVDNEEFALELTHSIQVLPWLEVQLDAQYIVNPGTDPTVDNALLLGMRTAIAF